MNIDLAVRQIVRDAREQGIEIDPIGLRANLERQETMDYNKAARFCLWTGAGLALVMFVAALYLGPKQNKPMGDQAYVQETPVQVQADPKPISVEIGEAVLDARSSAPKAIKTTTKHRPASSCQTKEWRALRGSPALSTKKSPEALTGQSVRVFCP